MAKTIDYEQTLKLAFDETIKYLNHKKKYAASKSNYEKICDAIDSVKKVRENPAKYADYNARVRDKVDTQMHVYGFVPDGTSDNTVLRAYSDILNSMGDLNRDQSYPREQAEQKLLAALKTIKYKNANVLLRDFTFPFRSPKSFAVAVKKQEER